MVLEIYDGQHASIIYPNINRDENINIKRFYNENLDIYIERKHDDIIIYCKIRAYGDPNRLKEYYNARYANRTDPFYVFYKDKYTQDSFTNFKTDTKKIFDDLGFELVFTEERDNVIFRYIEKLDLVHTGLNPLPPKDFDGIIHLIKDHERLEFKAGKFNDIATFCREILKSNIDNVTIVIFTGDTLVKEGSVNIFLGKNPEVSFALTDNTKKILDDYNKKLEKDRKEDVRRQAKRQANDEMKSGHDTAIRGFILFEQGKESMRKAGYSESEIEKDSDVRQLLYNLKSRLTSIGAGPKTGIDTITVGAVILAALIVGMVIGMYVQQNYLQGSFMKGSSDDQEEVIPIDTVISTTATGVPTPGISAIINNTTSPMPTTTAVSIVNVTINENGSTFTGGNNGTPTGLNKSKNMTWHPQLSLWS